jgi:hypothetical protein
VPLVPASGAGAEMRRSLGVAVFSGMLGVTFFGIFLTPVFYYVIRRFTTEKPRVETPPGALAAPRPPAIPPPRAETAIQAAGDGRGS